jgi:hypothetical protein
LALGAVVEVTIEFAGFYFCVAGFIIILFKFASDAFKLALFEAVLAFLQSIVLYHLLPPSVLSDAGSWSVHKIERPHTSVFSSILNVPGLCGPNDILRPGTVQLFIGPLSKK